MVAKRLIAVTAKCVQTAGEQRVEPSVKQKDGTTIDLNAFEKEGRKTGCHEQLGKCMKFEDH